MRRLFPKLIFIGSAEDCIERPLTAGAQHFVPPEKGSIQFYGFSTRLASIVAKVDTLLDFGLDATPDGRFVIYTLRDRETDELLLVDNFR